MARPLRLSFEHAVYHITARGNRRENIFFSDQDKGIFLDKLNETFEKYSFLCYAYCLMDNHYHLFVKTLLPNITEGMHYLNTSYSNWFKARHKIVGVIFQGRYKSILVDEVAYGMWLSTYIHLNPIRAHIVDNVKNYKWSSFLDYIGRKKSVERLDTEYILSNFDNNINKAKRKYERYVLENVLMDNPLKESYKGIALGGKVFIEKIKEKIKRVGKKREIGVTKLSVARTPEEILTVIQEEFAIGKKDIFQKQKGNMYRQLALYFMKKYTSLSLKDIGDLFMMDYAAVSQACKRYEEKTKKDGKALKMKIVAEENLKKKEIMSSVET